VGCTARSKKNQRESGEGVKTHGALMAKAASIFTTLITLKWKANQDLSKKQREEEIAFKRQIS
jgi:hypothetical protein